MAIRMKEWGMLAYPRQSVHLTGNALNDWGRSGQALGRGAEAAGHGAVALAEAMQRVSRTGNEADIAARLAGIGQETAEELRDKPVRDWDYSWQQAYEPRLRELLSELEPEAREQARQMSAEYSRTQSLQAHRAQEVERIRSARRRWQEQVEQAVQQGDAESACRWVEQGSSVFVPEPELPQQLESARSRSICARWQQMLQQEPAAALAAWAAPEAGRPARREELEQLEAGMEAARSRLAGTLAQQLAAAVEEGRAPSAAGLQQAAAAGLIAPELLAAHAQEPHPLGAAEACAWLRRIDEREPGADDELVVQIALAPLPPAERRVLLQRVQATAALPPQQRAATSRALWALYHAGSFGCPGDAAALRCLGRLQDEALQRQQAGPGGQDPAPWLEQLRRSGESWLCYQPR